MKVFITKYRRRSFSCIAGVILSVLLFFTWEISAYAATESEPNETAGAATEIPVNEVCEAVIDNHNDVDYFKIVIDQPGVISMEFAHDQYDSSNIWEYALRQDVAEKPLWEGSSRGNSTASAESPQFGAAPGTYYIKVSGYSMVGINYSVKLKYEPSTEWETEKNDDTASADEIIPGNAINGNIYTNNDEDYYKFSIDQPGKVSLEFSNDNVDSNNIWTIRLIGTTDDLWRRDVKGSNLTTVKSPDYGLAAGTYYVKVSGYSLTDIRYAVNIDYTPLANWEAELNNTIDTANEITFDSDVNGNIYRNNDVDYYKFSVSRPGKITFNFSNEYTDTINEWTAKIIAPSGSTAHTMQISGTNRGTQSSGEIDAEAGTYFIKVDGYSMTNVRYTINVNYSNPAARTEAFVTRLYQVGLGRDPEPDGLNDWTNRLVSGEANAVNVVQGVLCSPEYQSKGKSDGEVVNDCYQAMLGRAADESGYSDWVSRLQSGMSVNAIFAGFVGSEEFINLCNSYGITPGTYPITEERDKNLGVTTFVSRLYTQALGRNYDVDGLNDWCGQINANTSRDNILRVATDGFFHSQEFLNKNLNNEDFVKVCYRTYLGREYDESGLADWVGKLDRGEQNRDEVMAGFAYSPEFGNIMEQYGL